MSVTRVKLVVAYDGAAYEGWQVQSSGTGIQQRMEEALARIFPSRPDLHSSSRTDAGVHAMGMVAHFDVPGVEFKMDPSKLLLALNAWLPEDIRVMRVGRAPAGFHARYDASGKQYRYWVWNHPAANPLWRRQAWHVPRPLDRVAMRAAAGHFVGRHDFRSLAANRGDVLKNAVRTLTRCEMRGRGPLLSFLIEGDGFLYKMCRGIVGTLVQVGQGKLAASDIPRILARRDRRVAGMSAPAHGLVLWKVNYRRRRGEKADASGAH